MRSQPPDPPAITAGKDRTMVTQVREYRLITPLFGGGVSPAEIDPVTAIRGTAIRGHLRFWWRATWGGHYSELAELKKHEDELWGTAATRKRTPTNEQQKGKPQAETVQIKVEIIKPGILKPSYFLKVNDNDKKKRSFPSSGIPGYAAFPLQPDQEELSKERPEIKAVLDGTHFKLTISFPEAKKGQIEAALWAWETFGGIGARTRRGFGALQLLRIGDRENEDIPDAATIRTWLKEKFDCYISNDYPVKNVPHLSYRPNAIKTIGPFPDSYEAWKELISALQRFRQMRFGPRGRSQWPEAETIRAKTGDTYSLEPDYPQKFPRAAFGLPINFHFQGKSKGNPDADIILSGTTYDRLSSPLILRPIVCKNNQTVGLALLLQGLLNPPTDLVISGENYQPVDVDATLTPEEAKKIRPLAGQTDVLYAFMNRLQQNRTQGGKNR